jgi:hypothetical protein
MWREFRRRRCARLGIVAGVVAASLSPLTASAVTHADAGGRAGYCPRYDAYEVKDCQPRHRLPDSPVGRQLRWVLGGVLIDGVHPQYHRRSIEVAKQFVPPEHWNELIRAACGLLPVQLDAEQLDICLAEDQTLESLAVAPLHAMPVSVVTHGNLHFRPGSEPDAQERLWRQLQGELAAMVPGSRHWCERAAEANNANADDYLEDLLTDRPEPDVGSE